MSSATLARSVANHPNRSKQNIHVGANPKPAEISRVREDAGLTQGEFAALVYKGYRAVQEWESGERRMPPDTWELIQIKLAALRQLKRGEVARGDIRRLGIQLPEPKDPAP